MATGIEPLDITMKGLRNSEVTYVLGAPQQGKTTFAQNLIWSLAKREIKSTAIILEGDPAKFVTKLASIFAGTNINCVEDTSTIEAEMDSHVSVSMLTGRSYTKEKLAATVRAAVKAQDSRVIVLDNITGAVNPDKLFESASGIVLDLDDLARELKCHIIALSHIGRGNYDEPPKLGSGFGSGFIERFAYNVIGIHRSDSLTRIELLKDREGGSTGKHFYGELDLASARYRFFFKDKLSNVMRTDI